MNGVVFSAFAIAFVAAVEMPKDAGAIWRARDSSKDPHVTRARATGSIPMFVLLGDFLADRFQRLTDDRVFHRPFSVLALQASTKRKELRI